MLSRSSSQNYDQNNSRSTSLSKAAEEAKISSHAPIILFMGGPGGGKTRYAERIRNELEEKGLVHICMPDLIRHAIAKYKDSSVEWKEASEKYQRGELIPNKLAQQLIKAEMGRFPYARVYFLEGFPREAQQVEDFEKNVRRVNMALILDYDEDTLRSHMLTRGLLKEVVNRRIAEFKLKTLPSAKYFDDQRLLHLIPGEKEDKVIFERMLKLVKRAMAVGVDDKNSSLSSPETVQNPSSSQKSSHRLPSNTSNNEDENTSPPSSSPLKMLENDEERKPDSAKTSQPPFNEIPDIPALNKVVESPAQLVQQVIHKSLNTIQNGEEEALIQPVTTDQSKKENLESGRKSLDSATSKKSTERVSVKSIGSKSIVSTSKSVIGKNEINDEQNPTNISPQLVPNSPSLSQNFQNPLTNKLNSSDTFPKGLPTESNSPVILIIGGPGSNKSQFAQRVAKKYEGFVHISLGELLRHKVLQNNEDELWIRIGKKLDAGEVIPMKICRELLYSAIHEMGNRSWGYVIEGYPRTLPQAEDIENQLGRLDLAILIDCTEQYCKDNLKRRYQEGKEDGVERADDDESVVKVRLGYFKQNTLPMLKYLDDKGKLRVVRIPTASPPSPTNNDFVEIEGDANADKVFREIVNLIDNTVFIEDTGSGKSLGSSKQNSIDEEANPSLT